MKFTLCDFSRSLRVKYSLALFTFLLLAAVCCAPANAQLVINPTFGSTITSGSNAATVEAGINAAISRIEGDIATPITVSIDFENMSSGLGESSTFINFLSYSQYRSDLAAKQTSANDAIALASLPIQSANPVNGNANLVLTLPLLRAIGETALGNNGGGFDSTISLNLSDMNLSRTGAQNSSLYDLQAVATHEIDEVLGIGGDGSALPTTNSQVGVLDLFRYSANGVRSFTTSSSATSYFSIDGGATNLSNFNQSGGGSDYGDWATGSSPQVQDAFGTPGEDVNLGTDELTAFDIEGYTLVPEPGSIYLVAGGGLLAFVIHRRRRKAI